MTRRWGAAVVLLVAAVACWWVGATRLERVVPVGERRAMPAIEMAQRGGGVWRLTEHRGQVVVVNYWASWCGPCWEETPGLVRIAREFGAQVSVVGVAMDEGGREGVGSFVERFGVPYPVVFPVTGSQMVYGMGGLPETILVDREGRVAKVYGSAVEERELERAIGVLLAEGT